MASTITIPLTTIFTPPASCFEISSYESYDALAMGMGMGGDCNATPPVSGGRHVTVFSPGICPSGFHSACALDRTISPMTPSRPPYVPYSLAPGEFGQYCCPSGYTCLDDREQCRGPFTSPAVIHLWRRDQTDGWSSDSLITLTGRGSTYASALPVVIKWKKEDLSLFQTVEATTSETLITGASSKTLITEASNSKLPNTQINATATVTPSSSLGSSAIAGIVVGVILGLALLGAVVLLLLQHRRRQQHLQKEIDQDVGPGITEMDHRGYTNELDASNAVKAVATGVIGSGPEVELDGVSPVAENGKILGQIALVSSASNPQSQQSMFELEESQDKLQELETEQQSLPPMVLHDSEPQQGAQDLSVAPAPGQPEGTPASLEQGVNYASNSTADNSDNFAHSRAGPIEPYLETMSTATIAAVAPANNTEAAPRVTILVTDPIAQESQTRRDLELKRLQEEEERIRERRARILAGEEI